MASLKKNLVYNFLLSGSQVLLPLISIPYISRVLHPDGVGRVSFIDSFTYYFITVAEFGIMVYGMRAVAREKNNPAKLKILVSELLLLHVLSSLGTLVIYSIAVYFTWYKIHDTRLLFFSLSFLLINFFACEWYFLGLERFRFITIRSLVTRILGILSLFVLVKMPGDYYIYYGIIVSTAIANSIWNNIVLFREFPLDFRKVNWKKHIRFTWVTYLISLLYSITLLLDNVLLGLVSTTVAVGFYAFAMKIVKTAAMLFTDALLVFFPRIVSFVKEKEFAKLQKTITHSVQLIIFLSIPICTGLFILSDELVRLFLSEAFLPAALNLRILAFFPLLKAYNLFLSKQILIPFDKERLFLRSLFAGSCSFIVLTLVLSSWLQDNGASLAIIIAEAITLLINYFYVRKTAREINVFDLRMMFQALLASFLFVPFVYILKRELDADWQVLTISFAGCILIYCCFLLYVVKNDFANLVKISLIRVVQKKLQH